MDEGDQGELRRRRASQEGRDAEFEDGVKEYGTSEVIASSSEAPTSITTTERQESVKATPISPTSKVRFSVDLTREALPPSRAGVASRDGSSTSSSPATEKEMKPPRAQIATVDTPNIRRASISSHRRTTSSSTVSSPSKPQGKRNRGYSLRRSLFNRNILGPEAGTSSVIELVEGGNIQKGRPGTSQGVNGREEKKASQATVSIRATSSNEKEEAEIQRTIDQSRFKDHPIPTYDAWVRKSAARLGFFRPVRDGYRKASKFVLRINEIPPSKDGRQVNLDVLQKPDLLDERTGKPYIDNSIRSSRYTLWNFLPRQLLFQFSKLANFYFLCVSIMQMIPGLSTTGTYTTIVPLLFFVSISMAKEGFDDLRRYRLDKVENRKDVEVLLYSPENPQDPVQWVKKLWKDVAVGDVIKLYRNDASPADVLLLRASGPNNVAYIETMALDGETNLKSKRAVPILTDSWANVEGLAPSPARIVVQDPNDDLYTFEGRVTHTTNGHVTNLEEAYPLTNNEIIYRGSVLRNTPDAVGMVVYTGEECKIRMNANKNPRTKAPNLQRKTNSIVILIVVFVVALAVFETVSYQVWSEDTEEQSWYLQNAGVQFVPIFAGFIVMFNTMIPLSLYVSLEIVKLAQIFLMRDVDLYDPKSDTPLEPRTSTINEDLGQISHIFSDKTGTLTDNMMRFQKLSVFGTSWGLNSETTQNHQDHEPNSTVPENRRMSKGKKPVGRESKKSIGEVGPRSSITVRRPSKQIGDDNQHKLSSLLLYMSRNPENALVRKAEVFLLSIALCHTCLPEILEDGKIEFQAASPDELALVNAAQEMGYMLVDRQTGSISLRTPAKDSETDTINRVFDVLDIIEFSSKRKRMSIIVREHSPSGRIMIITKGADSSVIPLLRLSDLAMKKADAVEQRARERKSMEAQQAILRRNSDHVSRKSSLSRTSLNLARSSIGGTARHSFNPNRMQPIRDELDNWLSQQEQNGDSRSSTSASISATPRRSLAGRTSGFGLDSRKSVVFDSVEDVIAEAATFSDATVFERSFEHLDGFASEGLRTLLYGYRYLDEDEYQIWKKAFNEAETSLVNRQEKIEEIAHSMESALELAGVTAIEDRLQEGVPEAIEKLRRANIALWMLTGDKRETAINIGHSCRLIKDFSSVTILDHEKGNLERHAAAAIIDVSAGVSAHSVVVVDGKTLSVITSDATLKSLFYDLAIIVDTVICCRASPSQKAMLVRAVRRRVKHSITLAIGDGANDIAMIQEAHVGIGITGKEGMQAARTSDYSIAQFRFLLKLLLVHGRWNYIRICLYTLGTFWKEMLFYLTQALYQISVGHTGTSLYESWSLSMFNTLFTSLPVIFLGIFMKDLSASTLLAVPELYRKGQRSAAFNFKVYFGWMFMASAEASAVFNVMLRMYGQALFTKDNGLYAMGELTFSAIIIIIALKLLFLEMHNKSVMSAVGIFLSVGGWFLWNIILSATYKNNVTYNVKGGLLERFGDNILWWLSLILIVTICLLFEIIITALKVAYLPSDTDLFQAYEKDPVIRARFEEASASELSQSRMSSSMVIELPSRSKRPGYLRSKASREHQDRMNRELEVEDLLRRRRTMQDEDFNST